MSYELPKIVNRNAESTSKAYGLTNDDVKEFNIRLYDRLKAWLETKFIIADSLSNSESDYESLLPNHLEFTEEIFEILTEKDTHIILMSFALDATDKFMKRIIEEQIINLIKKRGNDLDNSNNVDDFDKNL